MSAEKHGWGSHYTGYGDNVHVNEVGGLGVNSAHASEDSIELMVSVWLCVCGEGSTGSPEGRVIEG
jgi:hypothetical protein